MSWHSPTAILACGSSPRGAPRSASSTYLCRLPSRCTALPATVALASASQQVERLSLSPSITPDCFYLLLWSHALYIHPTCLLLTCRVLCISVHKPRYQYFSHEVWRSAHLRLFDQTMRGATLYFPNRPSVLCVKPRKAAYLAAKFILIKRSSNWIREK